MQQSNSSTKLIVMGISGLVLVATLIITYVMAFVENPVWYDWMLDKESVRTEAAPMGVESTGMAKRYEGEILNIRFQYTDQQGNARQAGFQTYDDQLIASARSGKAIQIEYSPQDPKIVRVVGQPASFSGLAIFAPMAVAVISFFVFIFSLVSFLRGRSKAVHLT